MFTRLTITTFFLILSFTVSQTVLAQFSIIQDIMSGSSSSEPSDFAIFNGELYFAANDGSNGKELWKYDGINTPSMVADIRSGSLSSSPFNLIAFNNKLVFIANNGSNGKELWEYDGTNAPTMIADIASGGADGVRYKPVEFNNKLFFEGLDFTNGYALWEYDGTNAPSMVSDIYSGPFYEGTGVSDLTVFDGKLFFAADDESYGYELWSYDGSNPPALVQDINTVNSSFPDGLFVFNNKLYFNANDGNIGYELWEYDGSNAPSLVSNINPGNANAYPKNFMEFQGKLYFNADDGSNGQELWEYDGINSPTLVLNIRPGSSDSNPDELTVYKGKLYFSAHDGSTGVELWSYDGTNPPSLVDDLYSGQLNGYPDELIIFDGKLIMEASNGSTGFELWSYNGTCNCSTSNPIPKIAGTYSSTCSASDGAWKHYCDDSGNLLLSLNVGSSGAVINDNEVSLKIQDPTASFHPFECAAFPACFIDLPDGAVVFNRNWDVSPTTQPSTGNVGVRFYFSQSEYDAVNTEINNQGQTQLTGLDQMWFYKVTNPALGQFPNVFEIVANDIQIIKNHPSSPALDQWVLSTKSPGSEFTAEFEVNSFSGGGGGGAAAGALPLPVELLHFNVNPLGYDVQLTWATASETNNDKFEIYKSLDGEKWVLFDRLLGNGTSTIRQDYQLLDQNPYWGINYYKLAQIDFDGKSEILGVRSIDFSDHRNTNVKIFPNPVEHMINIIDGNGEAFIYDHSGYLTLQTTLNDKISTIDISDLHSGIYQLVIIPSYGKRIVERFIKKSSK